MKSGIIIFLYINITFLLQENKKIINIIFVICRCII